MKKTRLLEIIREEISSTLNETGLFTLKNPADLKKGLPQTTDPDDTTEKSPDFLRKYKKVTEVELEEEQLDEMAYDIVLSQPDQLSKLYDKIKDSTKKGDQLLIKAIEIIQRDKKEGKPIRQRDIANELGVIQQKVNPLINKLIDYGILDKGESVTGVTKKTTTDKTQGRPAKEKPSEEPKAKKEKAEKPSKEKPESKSKSKEEDEDDELEKADKEYYSSEEEETSTEKAPSGDKGTEQKARKQDELIKQYREVMDTYKNKKEEEGDEAAKEYLKSKQDIVQKYLKMKKVKA
jgi:hypothetical protein